MSVRVARAGFLSWFSPQKIVGPPYSHVVQIGDPILRQRARAVPLQKLKSEKTQHVIRKLRSVMDSYGAGGLSAPQIGVDLRIFVMQVTQAHIDAVNPDLVRVRGMTVVPYRVFINPRMKIYDRSEVVLPEGCESIRGFSAEVCRWKMVEVTGFNAEGGIQQVAFKDWAARIVQHEMDHLEGRMYTDFMNRNTLSCTCWDKVNTAQGKILLPFSPDC